MAAEDQKVCTLAEAMAEEGLVSLERATELIEQIVVALQAAQIRGRKHFHLEPRTILVSEPAEDVPGRGSRAKVIGLVPRPDTLSSAADGTPVPSQDDPGLAIDDPAQQVALAAIGYEMLAGCSPFAEDATLAPGGADPSSASPSSSSSSSSSSRTGPAPLSELVVGVPVSLDEVFRRALSPDPDHRFASLYDLVSTLRAIGGDGLDGDGNTEIGGDFFAENNRGAAAPEQAPLRLPPPTGEAIAWLTSTDERGSQTPSPGELTVVTPPPAAAGRATTPDPQTPMVLASLPTLAKPSRRTQVSFLAAALIIIVAAVGIMSGSRKKVSAEEPATVESTAAPIHPTVPMLPRLVPTAPGRPAVAPSPPVAEPEVSNETERTSHRRSRRHALHRPRAQRR